MLDEWQTVYTLIRHTLIRHSILKCLILVYIVFSGLAVSMLRVSTIIWSNRIPLRSFDPLPTFLPPPPPPPPCPHPPSSSYIIIGILIKVQVQGQHPHQWAPFQIAGLLHTWQVSHQISRYVYHEGCRPRASTLCNPSLSSWASQVHAFPQPVCEKLSWLHHWSIPHVHTSEAFSPSEWGPDLQSQAAQVAHWTWWWQCLVAWHCRSVWSLLCHSAADAGGFALSMAKSLTGIKHCTPHTRAVHTATCLEREVAWREDW